MISYKNRETGLYELYHHGKIVDTAGSQFEADEKQRLYERLVLGNRRTIVQKRQDKGKEHIRYIKMIADEIFCYGLSSVFPPRTSIDDCIKLALRLHVAKMGEYNLSPRNSGY